jgi:hypothetical protein
VDDLTVVAPNEGNYQVEVFGYTAAEYRLIVEVTANAAVATATGGVDPNKPALITPPMASGAEPSGQIALDPPELTASAGNLYLPVVER